MANMAIDSGRSRRRAVNSDLPLVPFIDFLLCLVAFLLVTAVWSQMARLNATANAGGVPGEVTLEPHRTLHVDVSTKDLFRLQWRDGETVIHSLDVPRRPRMVGASTDFTYPELAEALRVEWNNRGQHRAAADPGDDRLVLHLANALPFAEVAAVLDAAHEPRRPRDGRAGASGVPAFSVALAVD